MQLSFLPRILSLAFAGACLAQAQDGTPRWPAPFTTLSTRQDGDIVASPTTAPDGTLYVGVRIGLSTSLSQSGLLFALNPNGSEKWRFATPDWIDSTPAIGSDGTIYFGCWDGKLYALRPDGRPKWAPVNAGAYIASSPAIGPDGTLYVGAGNNLVAVNPDGTTRWTFPAVDWLDSSPAVGIDGTIYIGSWDGHLHAIRPDGTEKWRFLTNGALLASPALAADGTIYIGSENLNVYAISPTGALKWVVELDDTIDASPVLAPDGTVYIATTGGRVHAFTPQGQEKWRYPRASLPALNAITSTPAVRADGTIVFGSSNNALMALRADGTLLWQAPLGDYTDSSPLVTQDGVIYIGCADKMIYAFNSTAAASFTDWAQFRRNGQRTGWQPMGAVAGTIGRLKNVSVRTFAGAGDDTLIVGFIVGGGGARSLLVRGVGPTLGSFGVTETLSNPNLTLYNGGSGVLGTNEDWEGPPNDPSVITVTSASVGAFTLPPGSPDSALYSNFAAGGYTVHVSGSGSATGVALLEVYDASGSTTARLANISARSAIAAGDRTLIAGFVVEEHPRTVLIRGIGPALSAFGISGVLPNPQLRVFRENDLLAQNDDWSVSSNVAALADTARLVTPSFPLQSGSADAALLLTLPPGTYTAQVSGAVNSAPNGVGLVEVYEVP